MVHVFGVAMELAGLAFILYVQESQSIRWRYGENLAMRVLRCGHFAQNILQSEAPAPCTTTMVLVNRIPHELRWMMRTLSQIRNIN
jgi:hypothetical protein